MRELEAKLRVPAHSESGLLSLLGVLQDTATEVRQEDIVYALNETTILTALPGSVVARVRIQGDEISLTVKQRRLTELDRTEYEVSIDNAHAAMNILELLGLSLQIIVRKTRRIVRLSERCTVTLDNVEGLGNFIEIEVLDDPTADATLASVLEKIQGAPFPVQRESKGYDTLLLEKRAASRES
jgi:predicted adenylyl cyclase CyaB